MEGQPFEGDDFNLLDYILDANCSFIDPEDSLPDSSSNVFVASIQQGTDMMTYDSGKLNHDNPLETVSKTLIPTHNNSMAVFQTGIQLDSAMTGSDPQQNINHSQLVQNNMHAHVTIAPTFQASETSQIQLETSNTEQHQQPEALAHAGALELDPSKKRKRKKNVPKKPKKYQRSTPFEDKKMEAQRINAIKAKQYRDQKKRVEAQLREEAARLQHELKNSYLLKNQLIQEINNLRQENYQLKQLRKLIP